MWRFTKAAYKLLIQQQLSLLNNPSIQKKWWKGEMISVRPKAVTR